MRLLTGDYQGAAEALETALDIFRDLGDPGGEAEALNEAGALHRLRGDLGQAGACHRQALTLARELCSSLDEACALAGLGRCAMADGRTACACMTPSTITYWTCQLTAAAAAGRGRHERRIT